MAIGEDGGNARSARWRSLLSRLIVEGLAWSGPVALAAFVLLRLHRTSPGARDDFFFGAIVVAAAVVVFAVRRHVSPTQMMAIEVLATAVVEDYLSWRGGGDLRDLHLYLIAGANFMNHAAVYATTAIHSYPSDGFEFLPFLYAPPTLPFFGVLSQLPRGLVDVLWLGGSLAAVLVSLRAFGLAWRWAFAALIWTPIAQGLFVGNVVIPSVLLIGAATRVGGGLVLGPLLKPQNGIVSLWLLRERAWRSLAMGLAALLVLVVATLPFTGLDLWRQWFEGLAAYQQSQQYLPGLYGVGLGRYLPMWVFAAIAVLTVLGALWARGREGLARLALASVVASPSLYIHGFVFAIPSFLRMRAEWLWLAAGMACVSPMPGPQIALGIGVAAWFVKGMARDLEAEQAAGPANRPLHPLGAVREPWPGGEDRPVGGAEVL